MAEGTGLEPYSPCQSLVRGDGGFQDVQACVDLAIHLPVAHLADEHLAHPISAPSATHWAGLTGPCRVHFDHRHAREGGLVLNLTVDLTAAPGGKAAIHPAGAAACAVECEVLEDNRGPSAFSELHKSFRDSVQSLSDPMPLPLAFPIQQTTQDPSVPSLFLASLLRRRKWVSWTVRTPSKGRAVGTIRSPDATTPSRESSFVSRAIAASGS